MKTRYAEVTGNIGMTREQIAAYLPALYEVVGHDEERNAFLIRGKDNAGWTLDRYVIPRLRSGLYGCKEVEAPDDPRGPSVLARYTAAKLNRHDVEPTDCRPCGGTPCAMCRGDANFIDVQIRPLVEALDATASTVTRLEAHLRAIKGAADGASTELVGNNTAQAVAALEKLVVIE